MKVALGASVIVLLLLVPIAGAFAAQDKPVQSDVRVDSPQPIPEFLSSSDLDFSFHCDIDCGNGQTYTVEVESLRECVEICQDLCHDECGVAW